LRYLIKLESVGKPEVIVQNAPATVNPDDNWEKDRRLNSRRVTGIRYANVAEISDHITGV
jgi:rRNA maturation protein Nop10